MARSIMTIAAAVGLSLVLVAIAAPTATPRVAAVRDPIDWVAWSPGPKIVFDARDGTFVVNSSGTTRKLPTPRGKPVSSPSGRLLALSSEEGGIVLAFPNGKPHRKITRDGWLPSWSPAGQALAFHTIGLNRPAAVWTVRSDGRRERRLTRLPLAPTALRGPAWSRDGAWLVFDACLRTDPQDDEACGIGPRDIGVFTIRADGTQRRRVAYGTCPDWSPARLIAFVDQRNSGVAIGTLRIVKSDGSGARTVARGAASCPAWSPDGRSVAAEGARSLLVAMRGSWTVRRVGRLPPLPRCCSYPAPPAPAWSPDGGSVAVVRVLEGRNATLSYRLYVVRVRDGRTRLLLRTPYS